MSELLAPAGSMESLIAAIKSGANAIYLGMKSFGARAYASNFDYEQLKEAISYAHIRNVKIYVTMNTIVFDSELKDAYEQINKLNELGVDGLIIQDLALFDYVAKNFEELEAHTSTQMGIDDLDGTLLFKGLNAKRVVLSREVPLDKIKEIKQVTKLPIEVFVHGALCVSYSGNCLMSGLIGYRSGNRGRCVGSCRKKYKLINLDTNEVINDSYLYSMKDLNTYDKINDIAKYADSLKIEGRMKEPIYVSNVVRRYREKLDNNKINDKFLLNKTFNRTYTEGYILNASKDNITNIDRPNNYGYYIGKVLRKINGYYELQLNECLKQNDIIRIDSNNNDINLSIAKMYDNNYKLINKAYKENGKYKALIKIKETLNNNDSIYLTKDYEYSKKLEESINEEYQRFPLDIYVYGSPKDNLTIVGVCGDIQATIVSDFILEAALNKPTLKEDFIKQFDRLKDSVYKLLNVSFEVDNCFIPAKEINNLRRKLIDELNRQKIASRKYISFEEEKLDKLDIVNDTLNISVSCNTLDQVKACKELGIKYIYTKDNTIPRNNVVYKDYEGDLLVGGYGAINHYKNSNGFITDFSLNVVNHKAVYMLHKLGAKRVTLSYEMNQNQINDLVNTYYEKTGQYPNLEMIVYGHCHMLHTMYCPLKRLNMCGNCKKNKYAIVDEYGKFPIIFNDDCTTTLINGKVLNLIDDLDKIKNVNTFRVNLTIESYLESLNIIKAFINKINKKECNLHFNKDTDTRGHFNKEIL